MGNPSGIEIERMEILFGDFCFVQPRIGATKLPVESAFRFKGAMMQYPRARSKASTASMASRRALRTVRPR